MHLSQLIEDCVGTAEQLEEIRRLMCEQTTLDKVRTRLLYAQIFYLKRCLEPHFANTDQDMQASLFPVISKGHLSLLEVLVSKGVDLGVCDSVRLC
jgi:hypothetical protein